MDQIINISIAKMKSRSFQIGGNVKQKLIAVNDFTINWSFKMLLWKIRTQVKAQIFGNVIAYIKFSEVHLLFIVTALQSV